MRSKPDSTIVLQIEISPEKFAALFETDEVHKALVKAFRTMQREKQI
ncbi:MAG: hypothetical protein WA584_02055 [Pyrinomonadaceae bacterium]